MPRSISSTVHPGARVRGAGDGVGGSAGTEVGVATGLAVAVRAGATAGVAVPVRAGAASDATLEEGAAVGVEAAPEQAAERANRKMPRGGNRRIGTRLSTSTWPLLFREQEVVSGWKPLLLLQLDDALTNRMSNVTAGITGLRIRMVVLGPCEDVCRARRHLSKAGPQRRARFRGVPARGS